MAMAQPDEKNGAVEREGPAKRKSKTAKFNIDMDEIEEKVTKVKRNIGKKIVSLRNLTGKKKEEVKDPSIIKEATPRKVRFSTVCIRAYRTVPGFNPAVTSGPPVELGWEYIQSVPTDIEAYEAKQPHRTGKPEKDVPRLSAVDRIERLRRAKNSDHFIIISIEETDLLRKQRAQTVKRYYMVRNMKRFAWRCCLFLLPQRCIKKKVGTSLNTEAEVVV